MATATATLATAFASRRRSAPLARFIIRRIISMVLSLLVIVTVAFLALAFAPGDPVREAMGPTASAESIEARRQLLGLDLPLWQRYGDYLGDLVRGDFGYSYVTGQPVVDYIGARVPFTITLGLTALVVVALVAMPLGMTVAALTNGDRRRVLGLVFGALTGFFAAIPDYLLAVTLVVVFGLMWRVLPVAGAGQPSAYLLPTIALALPTIAVLARIARAEMARVLEQDYILTALYKRLRPGTIYIRHALPNAVTAVLTVGGTAFASLITATALVETVFNWPGLGMALATAISSRDYAIVLGIAVTYGIMIITIHTLVDLVLGAIRTRRSSGARR